ncbi:beta-lactamase family protein [Dactylosporangium aurantiacum]|uniref:Beta-lactamase family protein n=1 Tax=Dactylosporangium aurantiacum TaxID=35754 RepID=A0A9Q9IQY2_9ACTN|nr:serine hydrolase domain-containing protein [Dactylosporangium aurantiacum]MDG6103232.1 serine hydrolase [Dactylosporangium aurantiacum]UWZ57735.1 beta-lactamase family protein [Dactylosporangium aurantiacum]
MRRALLALCLAVPLLPVAPTAAWSAPPGCADPAGAAAFFDGALPPRLERFRVPGAVVAVTGRASTVFAKGYGLADVAAGRPFDPERSLVRIASVTKTFTWAAVRREAAAGRVDLDADVNTYLRGFAVPATFPRPVTLRALMDHTAGFEDRFVGVGARTAADVAPLETYLARHMPARIRPPGEVSAYSNYGAALAGYVVAQVSGEPFDRYVQAHILDPLGMAHTTAAEPVPAALAGDLARGYDSDAAPPAAIPFTFDRMPPDGSISATAADMAVYARAQLAEPPARSFAADAVLGGYAGGWMERFRNGHRVLMHDGSWEGFQSVLVLVPGCDLGLFVSANGTGGIEAFGEVMDAFFDRFTPAGPVAQTPAAATWPVRVTRSAPRAGFYQPARHAESTVEKLTTLLGSLRLSVDAAGAVHLKGRTWLPQPDGTFTAEDGRDHLVFLTGSGGRRYAATDGPTYELLDRTETLPFNLLVLLGFALVALSAVANLRRRTGASRRWRVSRALAAGACLTGLVFLAGLAVEVLYNPGAFLYGVPATFTLLLVLPLLALAGWAAAVAGTVTGWRARGARTAARVHQVVLLAGALPFAWFTWQWHLIGWWYP